MTLFDLQLGEEMIVHEIKPGVPYRTMQRLMELGVIEGAHLRVIQKTPFGGPIAVEVNNRNTLGLRTEEAHFIISAGKHTNAGRDS